MSSPFDPLHASRHTSTHTLTRQIRLWAEEACLSGGAGGLQCLPAVLLSGKANDDPDYAARQQDGQIVVPLHDRDNQSEKKRDAEAKDDSKCKRVNLAGEEAYCDSGDKPLSGRADNDPHDLRRYCRIGTQERG